MKVLIETSARHVHLSKDSLITLFGEEYELSPKRFLSQPGQFVSKERVKIIGPKGAIEGVSVLGPLRGKTQVELSLTDTRKVGILAPLRESGDLYQSAGCEIVGTKGSCFLEEGVIVAKRHIHMPLEYALKNGFSDRQIVCVRISNTGRSGILDDVIVRVSEKFNFAMHIDTDESNSFWLSSSEKNYGEIVLKN